MRITMVALLVLSIISCSTSNQPTGVSPSLETRELRILALGDSYTIGEAVPEAKRWPQQLSDSLAAHDIDIVEITYIATTGWTTTDLQSAIDVFKAGRDRNATSYDMVSLLIGVNNQFAGLELDLYAEEFAKLLEEAITFAADSPTRVVVISMPDYGVTPVGGSYGADRIRQEIDAYNDVNRRIADDFGARYVNITPISRRAAHDPTLIARDGLHPSGAMYAQWVALMLPIVTEILESTTGLE